MSAQVNVLLFCSKISRKGVKNLPFRYRSEPRTERKFFEELLVRFCNLVSLVSERIEFCGGQMANVLVVFSRPNNYKGCKVNFFHFKWTIQNYLTRVIWRPRGRGVFVANTPQNAFLFFVMLQRCTSIPGSADTVKFYIFFLSYKQSLYFSQCITIVFAGCYSTVRNLCWFISVYVFASFQNMLKPFRKQIQISIASKTTKTRHQKGKTIIPSLARQQVATKKISCLAEEG